MKLGSWGKWRVKRTAFIRSGYRRNLRNDARWTNASIVELNTAECKLWTNNPAGTSMNLP